MIQIIHNHCEWSVNHKLHSINKMLLQYQHFGFKIAIKARLDACHIRDFSKDDYVE